MTVPSIPQYSICMCNYNMAKTLERSLRSIANQLDDRFEILVVDDGSSDNSVEIIRFLQSEYPIIRLTELQRNRERRLGFTRNISIQEARGEYALIQLDCDDVYGPHIVDFVEVFHQLENCFRRDFFLKGSKINMARRGFLLSHGPYRNLFRGEDRDMWARLAATGNYVHLEHESFYSRLPKGRVESAVRTVNHTWDHMRSDFRSGASLPRYLVRETAKWPRRSLAVNILRLIYLLPTFIASKFLPPLKSSRAMEPGKTFAEYREANRKSFSKWLQGCNTVPDYSKLSLQGSKIFY